MDWQPFIMQWAPVGILFLPLLTFVYMLFAGTRISRPDYCAIGTMGVTFVLSVLLWYCNITVGGVTGAGGSTPQYEPVVSSISWMSFGDITLPMGFLIDNLSSFMCMVVTGLATLVLVYSTFYMHGDTMYNRYFYYMCFFCFAMLGIVLSNNLLMTFIFWELVGLGSYFLIGFWFYKPPVSKDHHYQELKASYATGIDERFLSPGFAQKKAFVMNRVGDFGFMTGIMIFAATMLCIPAANNDFAHSPLNFTSLYAARDLGYFDQSVLRIFGSDVTGNTLLTLAGIFTFMGAMGKSAQFPLHTWLPDAMQGPTTGSSIIHAATMVAAGVYMTARIHPLLTDGALFFVAIIGGLTAFIAASIAMVQWDLKAVLAYSTISQLGYMMIGLGANSYTAGIAHLYTHAVFKCMLFLCAGSVIHACHHLQDMNKMGGLRRKMPITFIASCAGVLAIIGFPLFSGFYSKDMILAASLATAIHDGGLHWIPYILGQVTAAMTTFYMCRWLFWTFFGTPRDHHVYDHAHESPPAATVPLAILATLCLGFWWSGNFNVVVAHPNAPGLTMTTQDLNEHGQLETVEKGWLDAAMVSPVAMKKMKETVALGPEEAAHRVHEHHHIHHLAHVWATGLSLSGMILGAILAWLMYGSKKMKPEAVMKNNGFLQVGYDLTSQLWFFDRFYQDGVVLWAKALNRALYVFDFAVLDQILIDGWAYFVRRLALIASTFDNWVVDRLVDLFGIVTWVAGSGLRSLQAGRVQYYVCVTFGAVAVALLLLLMM